MQLKIVPWYASLELFLMVLADFSKVLIWESFFIGGNLKGDNLKIFLHNYSRLP